MFNSIILSPTAYGKARRSNQSSSRRPPQWYTFVAQTDGKVIRQGVFRAERRGCVAAAGQGMSSVIALGGLWFEASFR